MTRLEHVKLFMDTLEFPEEAKADLLKVREDFVKTDYYKEFEAFYKEYEADYQNYNNHQNRMRLEEIAEESSFLEEQLYMIYFMELSQHLMKLYEENGISLDVYWDSMSDLKVKLMECKKVYDIWGTFVGGWFIGFFRLDRFKLGRLEYEIVGCEIEDYKKHGIELKSKDPVINIHIPSGEPFTFDIRLDSYKKAYEFYKEYRKGDLLPLVCSSWLLYPTNKEFYPENSNIIDFADDFEIFASGDQDEFHDSWRVFGKPNETPFDELPETTSLMRAYKKHLANKGKVGYGKGIIIFDGENVLTKGK
ncbi:MAG: DUF5596 domain-containing protein [Clostridia bacterium]|nr:DUF5596 domain-containing protein [Clostridia bacterium]